MRRQIVKNKQEFVEWVNAFNGKMNCYTTVYDFKYYAETSKVDSSVIIDRMFLDFAKAVNLIFKLNHNIFLQIK